MSEPLSLADSVTHLIFDCDGVLVDSEAIAVRVEEHWLRSAGFDISAVEISERFVGLSYATMASQLEDQFGRQLPEDLMENVMRETLDRFPEELEPISGIGALLAANALPRCVASSSKLDRIRLSLRLTDLDALFDDDLIFSAQMVDNGKPAPDLFLFAAEHMGADPASCVVVEDSPHGVTAGVAAGMTVIGLTAGGHATAALGSRLLDAGATTVVSNTTDLAKLIGV